MSMNIRHLTEGSCYLAGAANLGLLVKNNTALLVDSGLDSSAAKKTVKVFQENDLTPAGIILTHAHADHTGGAAYLKETWRVPVLASPLEKLFIEHPRLEPFYLFGGSQPLKELENKFLQAPPCPVDICLDPGCQDVLGFSLEIVALPGHTPGQIGLIYENTFYLADALFSPEILAKHGIPYFVDMAAALGTMEYLASCAKQCQRFVPAHAPAAEDISNLVTANRDYLHSMIDLILDALITPLSTTALLAVVCQKAGLVMTNPGQYYLNKAGLKSFLSYLSNSGQIQVIIKDNSLLWTRRKD